MSSLQERAAARRRELEQEKHFVLPLPGYADMYAVRYRVLTLEEQIKIEDRADGPSAERAVMIASDSLINGCIEFLEVKGPGEYAAIDHRWTPAMARELFGADLPAEATARDAVLAVFSGPLGTSRLVVHGRDFDDELNKALAGVHEVVTGESEPSVEGS